MVNSINTGYADLTYQAPKDIIITYIIKMEEYMADQVLEAQAIL